MPTATESKAAAKPKPAPKKPTAGDAEKKPAEAKKAAEADKKPAESKKPRTTSGSEKKRTISGSEKKQRTTSGSEKKQSTSGSEKKQRTTSGSEKKRTTSGSEKKPSGGKKQAPSRRQADTTEWADEPAPLPVYMPKLPVTLPVLNTLEWASCAKVLGNLLNLTPSLGAAIAQLKPFRSTQHLVDQLNLALDGLPPTYIEVFLKRFGELGLLPKDKLTKEHKCCVGLEKLSDELRAELTPLYAEYKDKFGFPFVVCAREAKAAELAVMLRSHLLNDKAQEVESGRKEVKKIARLRLLEVVAA